MRMITRLARRPGTRYARLAADLTVGFLLAVVEHLIVLVFRLLHGLPGMLYQAIRAARQFIIRLIRRPRPSQRPAKGDLAAPAMVKREFILPIAERPALRFDQVAGLVEVKKELMQRAILPARFPPKAREYGVRAGGGVLLYGEPGNGKTLVAKAIAGELAWPFFVVDSSDLLSHDVGRSESNVRRLFQTLRRAGHAVLFFDEADAIMPRRRSGFTHLRRVVGALLSEMDGFENALTDQSILVVAATNDLAAIDGAIIRSGRLRPIYVGFPDQKAREQILRANLCGCPLDPSIDLLELAALTDGLSGADVAGLAARARDRAFVRSLECGNEPSPILMSDLTATTGIVGADMLISQATLDEHAKGTGLKLASRRHIYRISG